jgi:hypothetical protein
MGGTKNQKDQEKLKAVPVAQSSSCEDDSVLITDSQDKDDFPYGFSGSKYFHENSVLKGEWARYKKEMKVVS